MMIWNFLRLVDENFMRRASFDQGKKYKSFYVVLSLNFRAKALHENIKPDFTC